jgi:hypothetical protein
MTKRGRRWPGFLLAATLGLGACWAWFDLRSSEPSPRAGSHDEALARGEQQEVQRPSAAGQAAHLARRPHPITPLHEAMAERRELIGALAAALAGQRYEDARALLGEAQELEKSHPESADPAGSTFAGAVRGYQLILECIAARGASSSESQELPDGLREESQRYLDQHRLPPRREVRRVCLEGRAFARRS